MKTRIKLPLRKVLAVAASAAMVAAMVPTAAIAARQPSAKPTVMVSNTKAVYDGEGHSLTVTAPAGYKVYYSKSKLSASKAAEKGSETSPIRINAGRTRVHYAVVPESGKVSASNSRTGVATLTVSKRAMSSVTMTPIPVQPFTGMAVKPAIELFSGGDRLVAGKDYSVSYSRNKRVGTAKALVQGKGNFTGVLTLRFRISNDAAPVVPPTTSSLSIYKQEIGNPSSKALVTTYNQDQLNALQAYGGYSYVKAPKIYTANALITASNLLACTGVTLDANTSVILRGSGGEATVNGPELTMQTSFFGGYTFNSGDPDPYLTATADAPSGLAITAKEYTPTSAMTATEAAAQCASAGPNGGTEVSMAWLMGAGSPGAADGRVATIMTGVSEITVVYDPSATPAPATAAFAVYSADDNSLAIYSDNTAPAAGDSYMGKTATAVYTGFESNTYSNADEVPWSEYRDTITSAVVVGTGCKPISTSYWFANCTNLQSISGLGNLDTSALASADCMFLSCSNLSTIDVTGWNTPSLTRMLGTFAGCTNLVSIPGLAALNTSSVVTMNSCFASCSMIEVIDIHGWSFESCIDVTEMFRDCTSLQTIYVDESWNDSTFYQNRSQVSSYQMFSNCSNLTNWSGGNTTGAEWAYIASPFVAGSSGYLTAWTE